MVFQDPENQLVMTNVENEMAFGMENMCVPTETMKERVQEYSEYLDLKRFLTRFIPELSGGEKQKVAMASILAMRPKYIVLDEPTSQLDGDNAVLFLEFLKQMNRELGISVILVEHRVERCIDYPDRIIIMDQGTIVKDGPRDEMIDHMKGMGLLNAPESRNVPIPDGNPDIIEAESICFGYEGREVLKGLGLKVKTGELVSITGDNGSGKSTLMKNLNGLLRPRTGDVKINGKSISGMTTASIARTDRLSGAEPQRLSVRGIARGGAQVHPQEHQDGREGMGREDQLGPEDPGPGTVPEAVPPGPQLRGEGAGGAGLDTGGPAQGADTGRADQGSGPVEQGQAGGYPGEAPGRRTDHHPGHA